MPQQLPAVSLVAVPGRRRATLDIAREIERRGYPAIYVPSLFDNMALCAALAHVTERIEFGTAITPIYARRAGDVAESAAFLHEVASGRFRLGLGVSHAPAHARFGVTPGKPRDDSRRFIAQLRAAQGLGALPPIYLAALRRQMVALAGEVADGLLIANGARSHMAASLAVLPAAKRDGPNFFIGNMIPTCICDDVAAARAVNRKTLTRYALLANYRNYWKEAGYVEEMCAVENAIREGRAAYVPNYLTDAWLADCTLFGPPRRVREGVEAWRAAGVNTPILVPSSVAGNQMTAIGEMFAAFAD